MRMWRAMMASLLLAAALAAQSAQPEGVPLHSPLDRALTAERVYVDCLVANARAFTNGRAAPQIAVNGARSRCRAELRALDDVYREWNSSRGQGRRGLSREDLRSLIDQATAQVIAERGGRPNP